MDRLQAVRSTPLAGVLSGLVLVACSRTNLVESPGRTDDAGNAPDATSARAMPSVRDASAADAAEAWDGCVIVDAGDVGQDGAYGSPGWTCTIPAQAPTSTICQVMSNQYGGCAPTQYYLSCSEEFDASSLGCTYGGFGTSVIGDAAPVRSYSYCCFCEGTDAATGCVNVDVSTYDRSCTKDSDCMYIGAGTWCPGDCGCCGWNAAVNGNGQTCYEQTLAQVALNYDCNCPLSPCASFDDGPVCLRGICTVPNNQ